MEKIFKSVKKKKVIVIQELYGLVNNTVLEFL